MGLIMGNKPELLSPAGDMERLIMAVTYGADAVYLAGKLFGMRAAANNFDPGQMREAVAFCKSRGVRVYAACNALPRNDEVRELPPFLESLQELGADGVIVSDLGVFMAAKRYAPKLELHISTQMGIVNYESARAWYDLGAKRVVLARELTLDEIIHIRQKCPADLELEAFVHGSMCVSFSGRCLLSNYMAGRDANRGECAQPCRWSYQLVEERRPGEYFPVMEDETGTHILNSKDLCMIGHIPQLMEAGIDSFKIEGRMKSSYYAAVITGAYRQALDAAIKKTPLDPAWLLEPEKVSHRHYYTGFYFGDSGNGQFYEDSKYVRLWDVAAYVMDCDQEGNATLSQRNRFCSGDTLELLRPGKKPVRFTAGPMEDENGNSIDCCPHPMMTVKMKLPATAEKYSILRRKSGDSPDK